MKWKFHFFLFPCAPFLNTKLLQFVVMATVNEWRSTSKNRNPNAEMRESFGQIKMLRILCFHLWHSLIDIISEINCCLLSSALLFNSSARQTIEFILISLRPLDVAMVNIGDDFLNGELWIRLINCVKSYVRLENVNEAHHSAHDDRPNAHQNSRFKFNTCIDTWCQTVFDGRHLIDAECRRWSQFQNGWELEVHAILFIRFWVRIHHSLHSLFLDRSTFHREKLLDLDRIDCRCTRENETKNETVKQRMKGKEYDLWRENNIGANAQTKHQSPTIAITTSATTAIVSMENGQS